MCFIIAEDMKLRFEENSLFTKEVEENTKLLRDSPEELSLTYSSQ